MLSDEQAEPEWTATPERSRPISTGSASTPSTPRHTRWGSRSGAAAPTTSTPSTASAASTTHRDLPPGRLGLHRDQLLTAGVQRRRRGPEADQRGDRLQPGPPPSLLFAAHQERLEPAPTPDDQGARSGHATQLVGAHADQVCVERGQIGRHVAAGGSGVHVHRDAGLAAQPDHLVDRLQRADLMVAPLAVHQRQGAVRDGDARRRRSASTSSRPVPSTRRSSTDATRAEASLTAECSTAAHRTGAPGAARVAPHTAALIDSVPPEVKTTCRGTTPNSPATCSRALSSASRTVRPSSCSRPGSPGGRVAHHVSAAIASGRGGVVLAWSR